MQADVKIHNQWVFTCWRRGRVLWREAFGNLVTNIGLEHINRRVIGGGGAPTFPGPGSVSGRAYPDGRSTPRAWSATTTVAVGDVIQPTFPNTHMYVCLTAGTTANPSPGEPTWPTVRGATVVDGTVTWMEFSYLYLGLKHGEDLPPHSPSGPQPGDTMLSHSPWTESTSYSSANRPAFINGAITSGATSNVDSIALFPINAADTLAGGFMCDFPAKGGFVGLLYAAGNFTSGSKQVNPGDLIGVSVTVSFTSA